MPAETPKRNFKPNKKFVVRDVPIYAERCHFCDCIWASSIKFSDVFVKGSKRKFRVCEHCVFVMYGGDPTINNNEVTSPTEAEEEVARTGESEEGSA